MKCNRCGKDNPAEIHTCTPKALVLANLLDNEVTPEGIEREVVAELRRLYSVNERLLRERHILVESSQKDAAAITEKDALLRQALEALELGVARLRFAAITALMERLK